MAVVMATHDDAMVEAVGAAVITLDASPPRPVEPVEMGPLARANPLALFAGALAPAVALLSTIDVVSASVALGLMLACLPLIARGVPRLAIRMLPVGLASVLSAVTIALYGQSSGELFFQWDLWWCQKGHSPWLLRLPFGFWRLVARPSFCFPR